MKDILTIKDFDLDLSRDFDTIAEEEEGITYIYGFVKHNSVREPFQHCWYYLNDLEVYIEPAISLYKKLEPSHQWFPVASFEQYQSILDVMELPGGKEIYERIQSS